MDAEKAQIRRMEVWDAGYDVEDMDAVLTKFDNVIGLSRLREVHLNNSLNDRGSRKDRHQASNSTAAGIPI